MKARFIVTKDIGKKTEQEQGEVDVEVFAAESINGKQAEIEMQVGFARGYGEIKVSAQVRIHCAQKKETVLKAGRAAHLLAYELAQDGFNMVCSDFDAGAKG